MRSRSHQLRSGRILGGSADCGLDHRVSIGAVLLLCKPTAVEARQRRLSIFCSILTPRSQHKKTPCNLDRGVLLGGHRKFGP